MARTKKTAPKPKPAVPTTKPVESPPAPTEADPAEPETQPPPRFPVVGIGASAGGLAAIEAFFSGMPADVDPGMAFVLVQHLSPDHKSILTGLVQRYTRMEVQEVVDGMQVRPNCAYIIPPNRDLAFLNGALHLLEPGAPRGLRLPIDFFFRSLAQDLREGAICVVLSGTGSDGTQGVRAVKGEGGLALAQTPASTEYDGMPQSAIATGLVDYVLPPAEMPAQLIAYASRAFGAGRTLVAAPQPKEKDTLQKVCIVLRDRTGHDFSQYKVNTLARRVERRMVIHRIDRAEQYLLYLQKNPAEADALFRDLLIGVTNFFRDPEAFEVLATQAIAPLTTGRPAGGIFRAWVCGCSTGEEAYSTAMLLQEQVEALQQATKVQVFATDIDRVAIEKARSGVYPASIAADITAERLARFFVQDPDDGSYRIQKNLRDLLIFSEQDVLKDPPFSKLDLVSCRNLMIYLNGALQKKLIPLFHYALNPNGFLFLGTSETVGEFSNLFETLDRKWKLYRKKESSADLRPALGEFVPTLGVDTARPRPPRASGQEATPVDFRALTEQTLLQHHDQAGVLVTGRGDILHIYGRTGHYLEPAPGAISANLLPMAREGLRRELTTALQRAVSRQEPVRYPGLRVKTNGDYTCVDLTVRPALGTPDLFLVVLEQAPPAAAEQDGTDTAASGDARIAVLEQELRAKEEYLQSTLEEMETSGEELKSTSEEMQSVNEELQSTNEELETSKEELQSVNEELSTVNAELQTKVADLTRANNDMNNLLAGTGIGTLFVDHQLRIARFTPAIARTINLIRTDVGRPVAHIVSNLEGYDRLVEDVQEVLDTLTPRQREVRTKTGVAYLMHIQPYRTVQNVIEGAVITFVDISEVQRLKAVLGEVRQKLCAEILGTLREPLLVLDQDLRVVLANRAFLATFQVSKEETEGSRVFDLGDRQWDVPELRPLLEEVLSRGTSFEDFEVTLDFPTLGRRTLRLNARRLRGEGNEAELILLAFEDVTTPRAAPGGS